MKVKTVGHHSPPSFFESQFHAAKVTAFEWARTILILNLFVQEAQSQFANFHFPLLVCVVIFAFQPARFVCTKSVSYPPIHLVVEMVLLQRATVEDGAGRKEHVEGTF